MQRRIAITTNMRISILLLLSLWSLSIFAQDISQFQTFTGYKYFIDAQPISKFEVEELLTEYPEALADWERAKRAGVMSGILIGAQLGLGYWTITRAAQFKTTAVPFFSMVAAGTAAIVFSFRRRKLMRTALLSHNQLNNQAGLSLSNNGIGLSWKF